MTKIGMFPIRVVAKRAGLTTHVIRIWERRYQAVVPSRTETNRRLYSEDDIERFSLLRRATEAGHSISQVAHLPIDQLRQLAAIAPAQSAPGHSLSSDPRGSATSALADCIVAIENLDGKSLELILTRAAINHTRPVVMEEIIVPLMHKIGDMWRNGNIRVAHEHLASSVIRIFLANIGSAYHVHESAPHLVITTPAGQLHEIGALLVMATAAAEGWYPDYMGPNLPAEEIAAAADHNKARAVALSIVYPADDPNVSAELRRLRRCLSPEVELLVGGRAAAGYKNTLDQIGATLINDLAHLRVELERIRSRTSPAMAGAHSTV